MRSEVNPVNMEGFLGFARAAVQGLRWWEVDISGAVISGLERVGLAKNVVRISPERQEQRRTQGVRRVQPAQD